MDEIPKPTKQWHTPDGKISVALYSSDPRSNVDESRVQREYNWPVIIGALREVVRYLRSSPSLLNLEPAKDRQSFVRASAARQTIGSIMTTAWHCFTIDPWRNDGIGVEEDQVADTLYLCHQEKPFLQSAAMDLWAEFRALWRQLSSRAVPRCSEQQIDRLEAAINTVAEMTIQVDDEAEQNGIRKNTQIPLQYVTLTQMAAMVNKTKRSLEKLKTDGKLPAPAVKGGRGKSDEWLWTEVRPFLEHEYGRALPERFPGGRFLR